MVTYYIVNRYILCNIILLWCNWKIYKLIERKFFIHTRHGFLTRFPPFLFFFFFLLWSLEYSNIISKTQRHTLEWLLYDLNSAAQLWLWQFGRKLLATWNILLYVWQLGKYRANKTDHARKFEVNPMTDKILICLHFLDWIVPLTPKLASLYHMHHLNMAQKL